MNGTLLLIDKYNEKHWFPKTSAVFPKNCLTSMSGGKQT